MGANINRAYQADTYRGDHVTGGTEKQDAYLSGIVVGRLQADRQDKSGDDEIAGVLEH